MEIERKNHSIAVYRVLNIKNIFTTMQRIEDFVKQKVNRREMPVAEKDHKRADMKFFNCPWQKIEQENIGMHFPEGIGQQLSTISPPWLTCEFGGR